MIEIAIDGTAASGKGTLAKKLARKYGFVHLDTGKRFYLSKTNAFIDEFRVTRAARYTSNFTAPTKSFANR